MIEKPLERLNYYNGQPMDASAFKTEQDYHIRTRRWLNKSLYSAGIARGLEVREVPGTRSVIVSPGLALDSDGREIILLEETPVEVCSFAGSGESTVEGNYLVIEYSEETIAYERGGCAVRATGTSASKSTTNWGGPSRIQAQVKFSWVPFVPRPGSNQIVLARVELNSTCSEVYQIDAGARRYIGSTSAAMVRQYALEGEREVAFIPKESFPAPKQGELDKREDVRVVGRIYFHVRGRQPNSVTLHLRSESFSSLRYTELGMHTHSANTTTSVEDHHIKLEHISHVHDLSGVITDEEKSDDFSEGPNRRAGQHYHWIYANVNKHGPGPNNLGAYGIDISHVSGGPPVEVLDNDVIAPDIANGLPPNEITPIIFGGRHRHTLIKDGAVGTHGPPKTGNPEGFTEIVLPHNNLSSTPSISPSGVALPSRTGEPLTFVSALRVCLGLAGNVTQVPNRTAEIQQQLADANRANWVDGAGNPKALGDGSENHVLSLSGTGPIRLDFLPGMTFAEGEYCIELKVDAKTEAGKRVANGGKILYNLYIE